MRIFFAFPAFIIATVFFISCISFKEIDTDYEYDEEMQETEISGTKTVFINDFNHKELFSLEGDYTGQTIIEYKNEKYFAYYEKTEGNLIIMCARNIKTRLPLENCSN